MKLSRKLAPLDIILIALACLLITIGIFLGTRASNRDFPITKISKSTKNSLTDSKPNGTITSVSGDKLQVTLPGNISRLVTVDANTRISTKTDVTMLSDVKPGTKVVLFTKQAGDSNVATSLFIQ